MTTIKVNNKDYEVITFNVCTTNKKITYSAISLAHGYLAIADQYRIYNTKSGEPVLRCRFSTLEDCIRFAEVLATTYKDYFDIWDVEPKADLICWCRYTVKDGLLIFEWKEILTKMDLVCKHDIEGAYLDAVSIISKQKQYV